MARAILFLVTLAVTGCAAAPDYAPPTDAEAKAAAIRAIRADLIDSAPEKALTGSIEIGPGDTPGSGMRKVASGLAAYGEMEDRASAPRRIASLASVHIGDCKWGSMRGSDVNAYGGKRVDSVGRGYRCRYEMTHDTDTRGPVRAEGEGFFFQREGEYDFASIEQGEFVELRRLAKP